MCLCDEILLFGSGTALERGVAFSGFGKRLCSRNDFFLFGRDRGLSSETWVGEEMWWVEDVTLLTLTVSPSCTSDCGRDVSERNLLQTKRVGGGLGMIRASSKWRQRYISQLG